MYERIIRRESRKIIRYIGKSNKENIRLLDFGCGKGVLLYWAKAAGFEVFGIETSIERARFAREEYGIERLDTFEYVDGQVFAERMDAITMLHVLEHLYNPRELLSRLISYNLKREGIFIVEVPNWNSWQRHIAGEEWLHIDISRHISHFDEDSLYTLLVKSNLRIVKTEYFSFHLGVLGMTDALLSRGRIRKGGKIIEKLKEYDMWTCLLVGVVLPLALILEAIAALLGRGGIIRVYCEY